MGNKLLNIILDLDKSRFDLELKNANKGLNDFASTGKNLNKMFSGLAVVSGLAAVTEELVASYKAAEEADKIQRQLTQTIITTGGTSGLTAVQIGEMDKSLSSLTGKSVETIEQFQNILATFRNIGKDVFPQATKAVMDYAATFNVDLPQAAKAVGMALNDPIQGLMKLSKAGVQFTQDQKDMITQLVRSGDIMGAQKVILDELNVRFGKAAETAKTAGEAYNTTTQEFQVALGRFTSSGIGKSFLDWLTNCINGLTGFIDQIRIATSEINKLNSTEIKQQIKTLEAETPGITGHRAPAVEDRLAILKNQLLTTENNEKKVNKTVLPKVNKGKATKGSTSTRNIQSDVLDLQRYGQEIEKNNRTSLEGIDDQEANLEILKNVRDNILATGYDENQKYYKEIESLGVEYAEKMRNIEVDAKRKASEEILKLKEAEQKKLAEIESPEIKKKIKVLLF